MLFFEQCTSPLAKASSNYVVIQILRRCFSLYLRWLSKNKEIIVPFSLGRRNIDLDLEHSQHLSPMRAILPLLLESAFTMNLLEFSKSQAYQKRIIDKQGVYFFLDRECFIWSL